MKTRRTHAKGAIAPLKPFDPVVEEYAQRQRHYRRMLLLAVASWFLPVAAGFFIGAGTALAALVIPIVMMVLMVRASKKHCCPSCGERVRDEDGDETWDAPEKCLNCGVRLRDHDPLEKQKQARAAAVFGTVFSLIFVAAGVALLIAFANTRRAADDSLSWPRVSGVIEEVAVGPRSSDTRVTYSYAVGGSSFRSHRIGFGATSYAEQAAREARYKRGNAVTVYVSPDDPNMAVLQPGRQRGNVYLAIAGLVLLSIGAGLLWLLRS